MHERAFEILGIDPTTDGRVIRNAFLRVARIYHPDRFVGLPADVRVEAERRMKDAVAAYEELRAAKKVAAERRVTSPPPTSTKRRSKDPWEEARRARDAVLARRREQEQSRARWLLWEELERQARERAAYEAEQASVWVNDTSGTIHLPDAPAPEPEPAHPSALSRRLAQARDGRSESLAPARQA